VKIPVPSALAGLRAGRSFVLHARARRHHWQGVGLLSIKAFFGGRAHYDLGRGHCAVDDRSYLVLNDGQPYAVDVQASQPVESFCVFFAKGFAEEVQRSLTLGTGRLLDEPVGAGTTRVRFFERTYQHDRVLSPALLRLRSLGREWDADEARLVEELHDVLQRLLRVHDLARVESERLECLRPATREELYRRVWRARDYAAASLPEPVTLATLARVSCLSPNHLLRTFRQAFGQTPHQFLVQRRLEEAKRLLADE
jgi:hypothetical protein